MPTRRSTRDRLLDAALRAFASNGVDGTPIIELEEAAGLAPGSGGFYRYYRTKEEVLEAAVRREIDSVIAERDAPEPDRPAGPREWLTNEFERALDTLANIGPLIAILARERSRIPALAREIATELVTGGARHDESLVSMARPANGGTDADAEAQGAVIVSAIVGYHLATEYFGAPPADVGRDRFVAALVALVLPE